eukprot:515459_1
MTDYYWLLELVDDCIDFLNKYSVNEQEINILCFGASLTKGYTNHGLEYYPYSDRLKEIICNYIENNNEYQQFGITYNIDLHNVGVNNECISDTMHDRLFNILNKSDIIFDMIIVCGGTNDIYCGYSVDKIWNNCNKMHKNINDIDFMESSSSITQIYDMIKEYKQNKDIKIVAVTITPFVKQTKSMDDVRNELNKHIINYCNEHENQKHMILCDLNNEFPRFEDTSKYWDKDGIHFSKMGYELFAEIMFKSIQKCLHSKTTL